MSSRSIEKLFLSIVKLGLWAIPVLPFYISSSMLFPFITGKNFMFRIITVTIFVLWAWLAMVREEYRPKLTPLFKAATIFVLIVFLADLLSPNINRSFFSNYERMEGFMMIGHLYLYFVLLASVFKSKKDWLIFFHVTLATSIAVSYVGLLQKFGLQVSHQGGFRVDSTIGNPTYLAAYLVFHIWLLLMLVKRFWHKWWLRILYLLFLGFELMILYFTATRGAVLAMVMVGVLFTAALAFWWPKVFKGHQYGRRIAFGILAAAILIPSTFWLVRNTEFVQTSLTLKRLTNYSLTEGTIQARFRIWNMSWQGFQERPILGWGQENYYLVFQKYYDSGLYGDEPWFDRSHNIVFDWLIHAGILGLVSYFAMLLMAFWGIWRAMQKGSMGYWDGLVIGGLFLSYLLQDFFVFDNLNTYLLFFAFLALVHHGGIPENNASVVSSRSRGPNRDIIQRATVLGGVLAVVAILVGNVIYIKPIKASKALIQSLRTYQVQADMDSVIGSFQYALSFNSFGNSEVREQMSNLARSIPDSSTYNPDEQKRFIDFTITELRKEIENDAPDVKHVLFLGALLNRATRIDPKYLPEAELLLTKAAELSPTKQVVYFELAQLYLNTGRMDEAVSALQTAWDLEHNFGEAGINLWLVGILANRPEIVEGVKAELDLRRVRTDGLIRVARAYEERQEFESALEIYEVLVEVAPAVPHYHLSYAALLAFFGRVDEARSEAEEAVRLDPSLEDEAKTFLDALQ